MKDQKTREAYDRLHQKLAKEFDTKESAVYVVRSFMLGDKKNKEEVLEWAKKKFDQSRRDKNQQNRSYTRTHPKEYYGEIIGLLASIDDKELKILLQPLETNTKKPKT